MSQRIKMASGDTTVVTADATDLLKQISNIIQKTGLQLGSLEQLWDDPSFQKVTGRLHELVTALTAPQLLDALSLLLPTCPNHDTFVMLSLENQVRWLMRRMTASQLIRVLQLHIGATTDVRRMVHDEALASLERRWVEIGSGHDLVSLLHLVPSDATHFLERLDMRGLELCEAMTAKELYRMTYILARRKRRSTPLLRALVHHLGRRSLEFSPVHLSNLAFAMATLNIYEPTLMAKIVTAAMAIAEGNASTPESVVASLSSLVQSFGILRWNDTRLLDTAVACFLRHREAVSAADWHRLMMTAAWIDYMPPQLGTDAIFSEICMSMSSLAESDPCAWLDVVWCCAVLQRMTANLAISVLSPNFISTLEKTINSSTMMAYGKLLNINAAVQIMIPGYSGPLLPPSFVDRTMVRIPARHHGKMFDSVIEALSQIAPAAQYIHSDICTVSGHMIHILMLMNDRAELQPFPMQGTSLPAGVHRVAIQLLSFADMTVGSVHPTGPVSLMTRTLLSAGYKVIQVPYTEFDITSTVVKRVQYLTRKLKGALPVATDETTAAASTANRQSTSTSSIDTKSIPSEGKINDDPQPNSSMQSGSAATSLNPLQEKFTNISNAASFQTESDTLLADVDAKKPTKP
jgi:hypothetical protein